jgi:hypothetical protein
MSLPQRESETVLKSRARKRSIAIVAPGFCNRSIRRSRARSRSGKDNTMGKTTAHFVRGS